MDEDGEPLEEVEESAEKKALRIRRAEAAHALLAEALKRGADPNFLSAEDRGTRRTLLLLAIR